MGALPLFHDPVTVEDLEQLPDNGARHELLDGRIVMTPPPGVRHHRVVDLLRRQLIGACDDHGWLIYENQGVLLGADMIIPDLTVYPEDAPVIRDRYVSGADTLLVVEVVSPSSRQDDRITKPVKCARYGVPLYLLVDPLESPLVATLYRLTGREYELFATVKAGEILTLPEPFGLDIDMARL
jgi:Uma2 family endonuclease